MDISAPIFVSFSLTDYCNLSCTHCAVDSQRKEKKAMKKSQIKKITDYCIENKVRVLEITGGEPLLFLPEILNIAEVAKKNNLLWGITTNGTLLDCNNVNKLKRAGIYAVKISLEGMEDCNDSIRGKGSFEKTVEGIKICLKKKLPVAVLTAVSKRNIGQMNEFVDFLDKLGVNMVIFFPMLPLGRAKKLGNHLLEKEELMRFAKLAKSKKTGQLKINMEMPEFEPQNGKNLAKGCPVGYSFHVCFDGNVWPCPVFPLNLGNINHVPIENIWKRRFFREIKDSSKLKGNCKTCKKKESCNGGCRAMSYITRGSYFEKDPYCPGQKNEI